MSTRKQRRKLAKTRRPKFKTYERINEREEIRDAVPDKYVPSISFAGQAFEPAHKVMVFPPVNKPMKVTTIWEDDQDNE